MGTVPATHEHLVRFYDRDDELVGELAGAVVEALTFGDTFVCVATPEHRAALATVLEARGIDLEGYGYLALDAEDLLGRFMVGNRPHPALFERVVGSLLEEVAAPGRHVRVYGEMVAVLWARGEARAAVRLEKLWNELARTHSFSLLCGYPTSALETASLSTATDACAEHTGVLPPASYATGATPAPLMPDSLVLVPVPEAVPTARRFVSSVLAPDLQGELLADAELVVSELATNAVRHASSAFRLSVRQVEGAVRLAVQDVDDSAPTVRDARPEDFGGRGVSIVGTLAERWGYDLLGDGKVVWAELAVP